MPRHLTLPPTFSSEMGLCRGPFSPPPIADCSYGLKPWLGSIGNGSLNTHPY